MRSISSLATKLSLDFPQFSFSAGEDFHWSPSTSTIFYDPTSRDSTALLHELAHGLLGHSDYSRDISLLGMERDAWEYARGTLGPRYKVSMTDEHIEAALDTYRDWLHARSTCPDCRATGVQSDKQQYTCLVCRTKWRVNDARLCHLRRYKVPS